MGDRDLTASLRVAAEQAHSIRGVEETGRPPLDKPPLDPRVLRNVIESYEGETIVVPQCDSPVFHGEGVAVFRTGFTYSGAFFFGRMHGRGRIDWSSGVVYEGDFADNEMSGHGSYTWPNGSTYVGDIVGGRRHGYGVFCTGTRGSVSLANSTFDPSVYAMSPLQFSFDDREAGATIDAASNARYEGSWIDGLPHGHGVLVFDDDQNVRYEGGFENGKRNGHGEMRYASGNVYVGQWEHDVKSGHGTMVWMAPGSTKAIEKYDGEWREDKPNGHGRHVWLGSVRVHREKNWYEGEFAHGVRHGLGAFFYANGARYEGEWVENVKHGVGAFYYEDGRVFVGEFRDDRPVEIGGAETAVHGTANGKTMLYVDDLLPHENLDRSRKLLENAVLRLNTELRALYRQYITLPPPGSPSRASISPNKNSLVIDEASGDSENGALLMEYYECRRLLADSGVRLTGGHLERRLETIRSAQQAAVIPTTVTLPQVRLTDPVALAASLPEVVPPVRLVLFREFVELLVRLAHEKEVVREFSDGRDDTHALLSLGDAFSSFYDEMSRYRQQQMGAAPINTMPSAPLHQLQARELHTVFQKHHRTLHELFASCDRRISPAKVEEAPERDEHTHGSPGTILVKSLIVRLQEIGVFTPSFRVRHALLALQALIPSDDVDPDSIDPYLVETDLLFTDFMDAIAVVLYAKDRVLHQGGQQNAGVPLFAVVDEFLHSKATRET